MDIYDGHINAIKFNPPTCLHFLHDTSFHNVLIGIQWLGAKYVEFSISKKRSQHIFLKQHIFSNDPVQISQITWKLLLSFFTFKNVYNFVLMNGVFHIQYNFKILHLPWFLESNKFNVILMQYLKLLSIWQFLEK